MPKDMERVWEEDDCTINDPLHVTVKQKYKELTGEDFDHTKAHTYEDAGDAFYYHMDTGYIVCISYPGNSAIYKPFV